MGCMAMVHHASLSTLFVGSLLMIATAPGCMTPGTFKRLSPTTCRGQNISSQQSHKSYRPLTVLSFRLTRQAWQLLPAAWTQPMHGALTKGSHGRVRGLGQPRLGRGRGALGFATATTGSGRGSSDGWGWATTSRGGVEAGVMVEGCFVGKVGLLGQGKACGYEGHPE